MINDDNQFDELLRDAAQSYNRPPAEAPRDAMWAGIEAAMADRALRPLHIVPPSPRRSLRTYTWLGAAVAAVLLVATGVGIGRWTSSNEAIPGTAKPSRSVASNTAKPTTPSSGNVAAESSPVTGEQSAGNGKHVAESGQRVAENGERRTENGQRRTENGERRTENGERRTATGQRSPVNDPSGVSPRQTVPYQVATIRHLANAEALLTAFRTDSRDPKMDAELSKWARELLSNTRLLLDSPAGDDPQRAKLLGDLELVLAQIVQLSPGAAAQDRELIEGSIRNGQVMTRLRYAIPAGPTRGL